MPTLVAVSVGMPQTHTSSVRDNHGRKWVSAILKRPVDGSVWVGSINLAGDAQADLKNHGGPDQAILGYSAEHYSYWRSVLPDVDWQYGGFGENFTISGQNEETVCLGDIYAAGTVRVQVTKPRAPCYKISRRYGLKALTALVEETGFHGWYYRVLKEGLVQAGQQIELIERLHPKISVHRMNEVLSAPEEFPELVAEIATSAATTEGWRRKMRAILEELLAR